ncbi:hypothetical protein CR513_42545, partial [Mucuna pruriens]
MKELVEQHSLDLFCGNAFKQSHPKTDFDNVSLRSDDFAKRPLLALKVKDFGLATLQEQSFDAWECASEEYKSESIQDMLRTSYDRLDVNAKRSFFNNGDKSYFLDSVERRRNLKKKKCFGTINFQPKECRVKPSLMSKYRCEEQRSIRIVNSLHLVYSSVSFNVRYMLQYMSKLLSSTYENQVYLICLMFAHIPTYTDVSVRVSLQVFHQPYLDLCRERKGEVGTWTQEYHQKEHRSTAQKKRRSSPTLKVLAKSFIDLGIFGPGGIEKTELAKALYEILCQTSMVQVFLPMLDRNQTKSMAWKIYIRHFYRRC